MKKILKNYKSTIILLISLIIGSIVGIIFKEKATILKPLGDVFINLLFVIIIPLVFLTITSSIIKMKSPKRLSKIMRSIVIVFVIMSVISAFIGIAATYKTKLVNTGDTENIMALMTENAEEGEELNILERTASLLTVSDFNLLLSKNAIIPVILIAIIFGLAIRKSKEKGEEAGKLIISLNEVVLNTINIIMYYAPIGLGCYFAALVGTYGNSIALGFLKTFIIYTTLSIFTYFVVYSIYAFIAAGKNGLKSYWKNILAPSATALATCSSAASIPVNIKCASSIGVPSDIAETTIPMGTSFHKDGSVIGSVFKIMFLVCLFGASPSIWKVLGVSLLATLLVTAVPVGGGTISEMLILNLMGFPLAALPILTIIATVIDAPATLLNVVGDTVSSMLVGRLVDGKNFLKKIKNK